jgi:hypothetical protein
VTWPNRLICGRRTRNVRLTELATAKQCPNLCRKCYQHVDRELDLLAIRRAPKPGLQLRLFEDW